MKIILILISCFLLFNCNKKYNIEEEKNEYYNFNNIKLNSNNMTFGLIYNNENYKLIFHGKENINAFYIIKNLNIDNNIPPYILDFELNEDKFIINELNKSPIYHEENNRISNKVNILNVSYKIYGLNEEQNYYITLIPNEELLNYMINLIDLYYLPLYVIQNNDTLSSICLELYGHTNYDQIIKYNSGMKLLNQYLVVRPNEKIRYKILDNNI